MDTAEDVKEDEEDVDVGDKDVAADKVAVATMVAETMDSSISHRQCNSIKPQRQYHKLEAFHLH